MRLSLHHVPWLSLVALPLLVAFYDWGVLATLLAVAAIALFRQAILLHSIPKSRPFPNGGHLNNNL